MTISMPVIRCTQPVVERLREILAEHPGVTDVHLRLTQPGRSTVMRLDNGLRIEKSPALYGDLKALLGPGCLA
jgi:DNA polymerase-3 subunit alpha